MFISLLASRALTHPHEAGRGLYDVCMIMCECCLSEVMVLGGSEQHVLVVNRPLATSIGLQLIVRVPLRDVGVGVAKQGPPSHRFTATQRSEG